MGVSWPSQSRTQEMLLERPSWVKISRFQPQSAAAAHTLLSISFLHLLWRRWSCVSSHCQQATPLRLRMVKVCQQKSTWLPRESTLRGAWTMTDQGTQWWAKSNDSHPDTSMLAQADVKIPGCCALGPPPRKCAPTTPSHCALPATWLALTGCDLKLSRTLQSRPTCDRPSPWILSASSRG